MSKATYHVPLFPLTPLIFVASSGAMVYAALDYAFRNWSLQGLWAVMVIIVGVVVGLWDRRLRRS